MEQLINDLQELYDDLLCGDEYYEDISSTAKLVRQAAEELSRYQTAEQEGRLVVLPCKPGDMVYRIEIDCLEGKCEHFYEGSDIFRDDDDCIIGYHNCNRRHIVPKVVGVMNICEYMFSPYDYNFGKDVFLTREEAEAALAEQREMEV